MLHRCGVELLANGGQKLFAHFPVIVEDADLDQFVTDQAGTDFVQHGFGQAVLADCNDGVQGVGTGAQGATLVCSNSKHQLNLIKERILQNFR